MCLTPAKLAGMRRGTLRRTIGQTGTPTLQDRGYVQAVEENAGGDRDRVADAGFVRPCFADSADTLPDMGTSAGSTLSIGQEMQMGITTSASQRQRAADQRPSAGAIHQRAGHASGLACEFGAHPVPLLLD